MPEKYSALFKSLCGNHNRPVDDSLSKTDIPSSIKGLDAWWSIVFPALLPFFIMSELLIGLGVVNFLGVLLEPVMRLLFNVPGAGAFVLAMGYTSGAPIGTLLTVNLRKKIYAPGRKPSG